MQKFGHAGALEEPSSPLLLPPRGGHCPEHARHHAAHQADRGLHHARTRRAGAALQPPPLFVLGNVALALQGLGPRRQLPVAAERLGHVDLLLLTLLARVLCEGQMMGLVRERVDCVRNAALVPPWRPVAAKVRRVGKRTVVHPLLRRARHIGDVVRPQGQHFVTLRSKVLVVVKVRAALEVGAVARLVLRGVLHDVVQAVLARRAQELLVNHLRQLAHVPVRILKHALPVRVDLRLGDAAFDDQLVVAVPQRTGVAEEVGIYVVED
mmetsp:Transcript_74201/g.211769  ORF Transcript_74201/g.211769 Transcript_74201/m.211769 type:complete len:267 (-) Transcript_74201:1364-2164(-)